MDHDYYTFRSITRGQLALRYLQAADVKATLVRTPRVLAAEGCGYAIRVRTGDSAAASRVFAENEVRYQRRFREQNGHFREVSHGVS